MMDYKARKTLGPPSRHDLLGPCVIDDKHGKIIATMNGFGSDEQYRLANKLAAAPELYEALLLVENVKELPIRDRDIIKAALAKARGESDGE